MRLALVLAASLVAFPVHADTAPAADDDHALEHDMSLDHMVREARRGRFSPGMCMYVYWAHKSGQHEAGRLLGELCAARNVPGVLPWMAWDAENGFDRPSDPAKAAEWDKKSADGGSPIGKLNYGLDLLRGHGVERDVIAGRRYVDEAAAMGDRTAKELAAGGYDPAIATPDADEERYLPPAY
jgi:uncharacterized protein